MIEIDGTISEIETAGTIEGAGATEAISGTAETIDGVGTAGTERYHDDEITEQTTASGTEVGATGRGLGAAGEAVPIETRANESGVSEADIR